MTEKAESFGEIVDPSKIRLSCPKCDSDAPNLISKGCPKCGFKPEIISYQEHHKIAKEQLAIEMREEEKKDKPSQFDLDMGFAQEAPKEEECSPTGTAKETSLSESIQPQEQLGALKPYSTEIPMIEGVKIPAGSLERLAKIKAKKAEFIQRFGGKPLSVWEVDVTENKFVEDIKERSQDKVWHDRYDGVFDPRFYESAGVSGKTVRGEKGGLSFFPYQVARKLLQFYSEEGDWILDPCAGHATRLTACFRLKRNYVGYDVSEKFMEHNKKLSEKFLTNTLVPAKTQIILKLKSSEFLDEKTDSIDFIMTSPPYWDTEFYGAEKEQIGWKKSYKQFLLGIRRILTSTLRVLKPEHYAAFVINDFRKDGIFRSYHVDFIELAKKVGWDMWDFIILVQPSSIAAAFVNQLVEQKRMAKSHEYVVILRKPKLCKIHYHKSAYQPIVDRCGFCEKGYVHYSWESETHESGKCDECEASSSRLIKR